MPQIKKYVSTVELLKVIEDSKNISESWNEFNEAMNAPSFHEYLSELMSERGIDTAQLGVRTLVSRSFAYQICSGERIPGRDIILRIALVLTLSLDDTQRLLSLANRGSLYPKVKRDSLYIYALTNKYSLYLTDELFTHYGQEPLLD